MQYPKLFEEIDVDFAYHICNPPYKPGTEVLSGTLFFRNNEKCMELVNAWIEGVTDNLSVIEQISLERVIGSIDNLKTYNLPSSYVKIFDLNEVGERNIRPVIEHHQSSRRYGRDL